MVDTEKKPSQNDDKSEPRNNSKQKDVNTRPSASNSSTGEDSSDSRWPTISRAANAARERWKPVVWPGTEANSNSETQSNKTETGESSTNKPQESVSRNLSPLEEVEALQRELDQIRQTEPSRARSQRLRDLWGQLLRKEALYSLADTRTGEVKTTERLVGREVRQMTNLVIRTIVESSQTADLSSNTVTNC